MAGDLFFTNGFIITLNPNGDIFENGDLLVREGVIEAVGTNLEAPPDFDGSLMDLQGKLVLPGTVNCHCHFEETAIRTLNYGLPLETWLSYKISALKFLDLSKEELTAILTLTCVDMLEHGVTSGLNHMRAGRAVEEDSLDAAIAAFVASGLRAVLCPQISDRPLRDQIPIDLEGLPDSVRAWFAAEQPPPTELILERAEAVLDKAEGARSSPHLGRHWPLIAPGVHGRASPGLCGLVGKARRSASHPSSGKPNAGSSRTEDVRFHHPGAPPRPGLSLPPDILRPCDLGQ